MLYDWLATWKQQVKIILLRPLCDPTNPNLCADFISQTLNVNTKQKV